MNDYAGIVDDDGLVCMRVANFDGLAFRVCLGNGREVTVAIDRSSPVQVERGQKLAKALTAFLGKLPETGN